METSSGHPEQGVNPEQAEETVEDLAKAHILRMMRKHDGVDEGYYTQYLDDNEELTNISPEELKRFAMAEISSRAKEKVAKSREGHIDRLQKMTDDPIRGVPIKIEDHDR